MMSTIRWTAGVVCLGTFIYIAALNWAIVWQDIAKRKHSSWVPVLGGLLGVAGVVTVPLTGLHA